MKNIQLFLLVLIFLMVSSAIVSCASTHEDLIKNETVKIERIPSREYRITRVFAYNENNVLVVTGRVERWNSTYSGSGHIDIAIVDPEGNITNRISTYYIPRLVCRNPSHGSRFEVRLSNIPSMGSIIRIAHHRNIIPQNESFQCKNNIAIPNT